jgi:hypothetical protein
MSRNGSQHAAGGTTVKRAIEVRSVSFLKYLIMMCSMAFLLVDGRTARSAIILMADAAYGSPPNVFTIDPEGLGTAERGIAGTRHLRQTFQTSETLTVGEIVLSLNTNGNDGGLVVNVFEVEDVNATTFTPGDLVTTLTIPTSVDIPDSMSRLGLQLTGSDAFVLPQRNTGTQGYGLEISNADDTTTIGVIRHTNSGMDEFTSGRYYTEDGGDSGNGDRDFGVALNPVPEPTSLLLVVVGAAALGLRRSRVVLRNRRGGNER